MEIVKLTVLAVCAGVIAVIVRRKEPDMAAMVTAACGLIVMLYVIDWLMRMVDSLRGLADELFIPEGSMSTVLKMIGVAYICEFACGLLRDLGETSLTGKVEMAGRAVIVALVLPMVIDFMKSVLALSGSV